MKPFYVVLISVLFLACGNISESDAIFPYKTYRDIPVVIQYEINAIEEIKKNTESFVYGMIMTNETFYDEDQNIGGFSALFCDWLSDFFGIKFVPAIFTWDNLLSGLASGAIDFSGEITASEERRKIYYMTDTIAERSVKYMRLQNSAPLDIIAGSRPLRYAFLEGSTTVNDISKHLMKEKFEVFLVSNCLMAYTMLKSGEIDAFFGEGVEASFDIYADVVTQEVFPSFFSSVSLSSQKSELLPFITVMQKALESGAIRYLTELYNKGERDYKRHKLFMRLNDEEKSFIQSQSAVALAAEYDNYPISFYDTRKKEWQGIAHDVLREIEFLTGLSFEIINKPNTERHVLLKMLEDGEASIISELLCCDDSGNRFIWTSNTVFTEYPALLSNIDFRNIKLNEVLFLKVGLVDEQEQSDMFRRWFPNHKNTVSFTNVNAAFRALERREIDLFMSSQSRLLAYTHFLEQVGFKANITFNYPMESTFGFNRDNEILCSIFDKAIALIDTDEIKSFWFNKTYDYRRNLVETRIPLLAGLFILSLFIIILIYILLQRNRSEGKKFETLVKERTNELRRSRHDLEEALKTAKAASVSKSVFLANMSHEIRTPMNSIVGFSELALDCEASPKTRDYLKKILTNATWLLQIVNDILDISKIESGKMELECIPFDLHELFSSCRSLVLPKAVEKGIILHFYAEPSIGRRPLGDPTRLRQVFVNLLTNAIKFANSGMVKLLSDIINMDDDTITIHFEIKDSGIGMSNEQIERIFDPFTQGETGTTRKYGGTGLGLAITRNIVEKMGGKLSVESALGIGSKFSFDITFKTINITEEEKFERKPFIDIEKPTFEGEVLVCEDNAMNQMVICEHLSRVGIKSVVAENGKICVDLIKERMDNGEKQVDLIFMDIHMPVMDGIDASQKIIEFNLGIPIVAMTANVMSDDLEIYKQSGMRECLSKPFTSQELWRCLLKYFSPLGFEGEKAEKISQETYDIEFIVSLQQLFIKYNKKKYDEIVAALEAKDVKLAHRLAHSLKANAGQIGLSNLQRVASDIENFLRDSGYASPQQLTVLKTELNTSIAELTKKLALYHSIESEMASSAVEEAGEQPNKQEILELIIALETMLRLGNAGSLELVGSLRRIPVDEELKNQLVQQILDFEFESAMITLAKIKKGLVSDNK
ncbi:MAG: ATP-binding protein [Treponema sp.]|nr:ATP-binding protein [Treponema sp.]